MIKYEDNCVDCDLPCIGRNCPCINVKHLYCDKCGYEAEKLYILEGEQLCEECLMETIETIGLDD